MFSLLGNHFFFQRKSCSQNLFLHFIILLQIMKITTVLPYSRKVLQSFQASGPLIILVPLLFPRFESLGGIKDINCIHSSFYPLSPTNLQHMNIIFFHSQSQLLQIMGLLMAVPMLLCRTTSVVPIISKNC